MPRMTKAQRESDTNYQTAVDWLLRQTTLDVEYTFFAIADGWITDDDAQRGYTDDGTDVGELIKQRRGERP